MYVDPTGHWEEGDSERSAEVQAQILEATREYDEAKKRGDKEGMKAAHYKAEAARDGIIYKAKSYTKTSLEEELEYISNSIYVSSSAKQDLNNSTINQVTRKPSNEANKAVQDEILYEINKARVYSTIINPNSTIEDLYKLDFNKMKDQAVQIRVEGNKVYIKSYINFTGDANDIFGSTGKTYAELAVAGIEDYWTTTFKGSNYDFIKGLKGNVVTEVVYMVPGQQYDNNSSQEYMNIHIDNSKPNLISSWFGFNLSESDRKHRSHMDGGREWSITNTGRITLYEGQHEVSLYSNPVQGYKSVAAHEFGHTLGISDAYERIGIKAASKITIEVPSNDIMRETYGIVNANTIEMILEAWSTNQWQYFDGHNSQKKSKAIKFK
jgi:hypothetical protein